MRVGDPVLLRSIYRGNVRWSWPHRYVGDWDGRHGIYVQPGSQGKLRPGPLVLRADWHVLHLV